MSMNGGLSHQGMCRDKAYRPKLARHKDKTDQEEMNTMKSRDDIEKQADTLWQRNPKITYQYLILEVLLDIRELLQPGRKDE